MRRGRALVGIVCLAPVVALLAGCGGPDEESDEAAEVRVATYRPTERVAPGVMFARIEVEDSCVVLVRPGAGELVSVLFPEEEVQTSENGFTLAGETFTVGDRVNIPGAYLAKPAGVDWNGCERPDIDDVWVVARSES